jgi:hypothetical protein
MVDVSVAEDGADDEFGLRPVGERGGVSGDIGDGAAEPVLAGH